MLKCCHWRRHHREGDRGRQRKKERKRGYAHFAISLFIIITATTNVSFPIRLRDAETRQIFAKPNRFVGIVKPLSWCTYLEICVLYAFVIASYRFIHVEKFNKCEWAGREWRACCSSCKTEWEWSNRKSSALTVHRTHSHAHTHSFMNHIIKILLKTLLPY